MNDVLAVVPARRGSGGLKNKDILPFGNGNLLSHKLNQLKNVRGIDIILSTEDDEIMSIGESMGVKVIKRPKELALPETNFGDFVEYICGIVQHEHLMWTCVTSPLVNERIYQNSLKLYFDKISQGFDSLITVQRLQRYLMDDNGAINFKPGRNVYLQNKVKPLFVFTNGISIAQRNDMKQWRYTSGYIPYMYELGKKESIDICDEYDYECAAMFYDKEYEEERMNDNYS